VIIACGKCDCVVDKALQTVEAEQPVTSLELTELQQQMEEIQCEMDKRTERVAKYKRLYSEEKKKCEEVTAQLQMLLQVLSCNKLFQRCNRKYMLFTRKSVVLWPASDHV